MIATDPRRHLPLDAPSSTATASSNEPLTIALSRHPREDGLIFDFAGSSPPCAGPMNSVRATTLSSVYLAMRHIFPEVPISAGAFEPLTVTGIDGTFLDAHYPRPVSGCAAEVSQRIAEAVFAALVAATPRPRHRRARRHLRQLRARRPRPRARPRLRHVPDLRRRLRRQRRPRRPLERLLDHRHLQGAPRRDHGAAIPGPLPPLRAARRLRRRRRAPRRLRPRLRGRAPARHRPGELRHGPRPLRPAGRARRRATAASTASR